MESELDNKSIKTESNSFSLPEDVNDNANLSLSSLDLSDISSEVINKTNLFYGNRTEAKKAILREYSKKSSVHGLNYILQIHRPVYEKLYWIIAMLISLYLAIYYIWGNYVKWSNTPIVFDETFVNIYEIPFPTVTICMDDQPELKILSAFEKRNNISEEEFQQLLSDIRVLKKFPQLLKDMDILERKTDLSVAQKLIHLGNTFKTTFLRQNRFKGEDIQPETILTDDGVCYQFNGLSHRDMYRNIEYDNVIRYLSNNTQIDYMENWSLDGGYQNSHVYPKRTSSSSVYGGLELFFASFNSSKIYVNSPDNILLTTKDYFIKDSNSQDVIVTILPQYIKSQENIMTFDVKKRQCYFNKERYLRFFKLYTQNNCRTECLTNFTIEQCGCVKFWMPKPTDIPYCDINNSTCCTKAAEELDVILTNQTFQNTRYPKLKIMCDCIPSCNALEYNLEITKVNVDIEAYYKSNRMLNYYYKLGDFREYYLVFHYKETQFIAIKRTVLYDRTQFIANCGAIFGVFMGGSIISLIEFIYFFSLRLVNNYRKRFLIQKKLKQFNGN